MAKELTEEQKLRRKERAAARREKKRKLNEMVVFNYTTYSPRNRAEELYKYTDKLEKELKVIAEQQSTHTRKITVRTWSDSEDHEMVKFCIGAPRKFEGHLQQFFDEKKQSAPWWVDYGINGLYITTK